MDFKEQEKLIGSESLTVVGAMQKIDKAAKGIIFIVDENNRLIGSLTDGDVRRFILRTGSLEGTVGQMMHQNVRYIMDGDQDNAYNLMKEASIHVVPVVDENHHIIDILTDHKDNTNKAHSMALKDIPVIVMAGGKGTRLFPYTKILPKPLIPIGDIPILQRILDQLNRYGAEHFFITVNYKKEIIKAFFKELDPAYDICFIEENEPLGTAGSIQLIQKKFENPVIVTNCDILIKADFGKLIKYHEESGNKITIVSSLKMMTIPYGVIHAQKDGIISSMEEKPQLSYLINTGMYVVEPEFFNRIPKGKVFHMTDLVDSLLKDGYKVGLYPISEDSYLDMGQFEEMKRMEEIINSEYERSL